MHGPVTRHVHNCVACGQLVLCQTDECLRRDVTCESCIERSYEERYGHPARAAYSGYYPLDGRTGPLPVWDSRSREASEVRDYFGALITPGVQIAYVSPGMRPTLSHGIVLGIEPCRRRLLKAALQIHVKTHRGVHVRLFDPQRMIVLGRT
jgi:hypothetical protein